LPFWQGKSNVNCPINATSSKVIGYLEKNNFWIGRIKFYSRIFRSVRSSSGKFSSSWKSPEKNEELNQKLIQFARGQGISVSFNNLNSDAQGVSKGGEIIIDPSAGTKTLIHEIAHELMHKDENNIQSRATKELEAESVAYVVSKHFRLECLNSPNYIALHGNDAKDIIASMDRIVKTAYEIIEFVEGKLNSDKFNEQTKVCA